jgi:hypothetical protein
MVFLRVPARLDRIASSNNFSCGVTVMILVKLLGFCEAVMELLR